MPQVLIPKMGLATAVLYKGAMDLFFFGLVFCITVLAFSTMFYVQLGPVMEGYFDQTASFISLSRALFGDFDVPDILNNSRGCALAPAHSVCSVHRAQTPRAACRRYVNVGLFILYLFVAVFIMLSMFLAILGESQNAVRMEQDEQRRLGRAPPEYGIFHYLGQGLQRAYHWARCQTARAKTASPTHCGPATDDAERGMPGAPPPPTGDSALPPAADDAAAEGVWGPPVAPPKLNLQPLAPEAALACGQSDGSGGREAEALRELSRGSRGSSAAGSRHTTARVRPALSATPCDGHTPRTTQALSMRTEIQDLAAELAAVAERQRKMHQHLRQLDLRSFAATIAGLTAAVEESTGRGVNGNGAGGGGGGGGGLGGVAPPRQGAGHPLQRLKRPSRGDPSRGSVPMPPLVDVCLAHANTCAANAEPLAGPPLAGASVGERGGARPAQQSALLPSVLADADEPAARGRRGGRGPPPLPAAHAAEAGVTTLGRQGWQRARKAIREHLDDGGTPSGERRRERAPSVRGLGREGLRGLARALSPPRHRV